MIASTPSGSMERFIRTLVQVAVAAAASLPVIANLHLTPAEITTVVSVIVLAVNAAQNALEAKGKVPAMLRYVPPAEPVATEPPAPGPAAQ